jgi:uncharacterized protein (DUF58 family)
MYISVRLAVVAVVGGVIAAFLPFPVWLSLLSVNVVLGIAVWMDVVRAPRANTLQIERHAPSVSASDRQDAMELRIHNPTERAVEVEIRDATPPSLRREPLRDRTVLPARAWRTVSATVRPSRRGYADVGPFTVRTSGPFRIAGRQGTIRSTARIKVYPPLPGRAQIVRRLDRVRALNTGSRSSAFRGGGNEFDSLREYHADDEFRRMDWGATSRAGKPITRVYREERDQQLLLLLDAGRGMATSIDETARFELAIDAAFALAELAAYVGDHVGMLAFGGDVHRMIGPRGGREQPRRILDLLFDVEPVLQAPDYAAAFATVLSRYRRRALLVLFTELTDASAMEPLFRTLPALLARHLVVVASVRDPGTEALARSEPTDAESAYLKAAAAESLSVRERAAQRLRGLGANVEDRLPGELATSVADRYLAIKSAGRL